MGIERPQTVERSTNSLLVLCLKILCLGSNGLTQARLRGAQDELCDTSRASNFDCAAQCRDIYVLRWDRYEVLELSFGFDLAYGFISAGGRAGSSHVHDVRKVIDPYAKLCISLSLQEGFFDAES